MPCDDGQPMSDTHNCTLPGGKVHSESMNVSIFNLSGRKRGAKQPLLKQCLNITQIMCVTLPNTKQSSAKQKAALFLRVNMPLAAAQIHMHKLNRQPYTYAHHMHSGMLTCSCAHTNYLWNMLIPKTKESFTHIHKSWYIALMPVTP